jgi:hypothetical protein
VATGRFDRSIAIAISSQTFLPEDANLGTDGANRTRRVSIQIEYGHMFVEREGIVAFLPQKRAFAAITLTAGGGWNLLPTQGGDLGR